MPTSPRVDRQESARTQTTCDDGAAVAKHDPSFADHIRHGAANFAGRAIATVFLPPGLAAGVKCYNN